MRARMAIYTAQVQVEQVINESLDIMIWVLSK
jgi:hypothetical protein